MIKKFLASVFILVPILIVTPASSQELPTLEKKTTKGMQSRSYSISEDKKKQLEEKIRENNPKPGQTDSESAQTSEDIPQENTPSVTAKKKQVSYSEDRVWKKYKTLTGEGDKDTDSQDSALENSQEEPDEETEDSSEDQQASVEQEDISGMASILQKYKNRNKAEMQSRSFARTEEIEKIEKEEASEETQNFHKKEEIMKKSEEQESKQSPSPTKNSKKTKMHSKSRKPLNTFETNG